MSEQQTHILTPEHDPNAKGRNPVSLNLESIRKLAALRLPEYAIASALGISDETFSQRKKRHPEVVQAIRQGQADAQIEVAEALREAATAKGVVGTAERIFLAKQPAERGGLGMVDRIDHRHEGTVNHVMMPALDQWQKAKQLAQETDIIEGDYEVVD